MEMISGLRWKQEFINSMKRREHFGNIPKRMAWLAMAPRGFALMEMTSGLRVAIGEEERRKHSRVTTNPLANGKSIPQPMC